LVVEVIVEEVLEMRAVQKVRQYLVRKATSPIRQAVGKSVGTNDTVITP
jgi:hypothetical protein